MICKLCGENKNLIDAHIVPKALIREILPSDGKALMIIEKGLPFTPKSWSGEYDSEILCSSCDAYLGIFEEIGINILRSVESYETIVSSVDQRVKVYKLIDFNYVSFKLFILSILWKASISKRFAYEAVCLGSYENQVKQMLLNKDFGKDEEFSVFIGKYRPSEINEYQQVKHVMHKVMMSPLKIRIDNITYYELPLLEYMVYVKVSNRPVPRRVLPFSLMKDQPFHIFEMAFDGSHKHKNLLQSVLNQHKIEKAYKQKRDAAKSKCF